MANLRVISPLSFLLLAVIAAMMTPFGALAHPSDNAELTDNTEMAEIHEADQAPRTNTGATIDWAVVEPQDRARRVRTRELLDAGVLQTANDYFRAATVFQHGQDAADYLLAHTLAIVAVAKGREDAAWMAAATLDRYLQAIGQSQIYGTQFSTPDLRNTTQEPYDRNIVSDALRKELGVPSQAEQEDRRRRIEARYRDALG